MKQGYTSFSGTVRELRDILFDNITLMGDVYQRRLNREYRACTAILDKMLTDSTRALESLKNLQYERPRIYIHVVRP